MFETLILLRELQQLFPAKAPKLTIQQDELVVEVWPDERESWEVTCEAADLEMSPINLAAAVADHIRKGNQDKPIEE
jgi:hypothetical protein